MSNEITANSQLSFVKIFWFTVSFLMGVIYILIRSSLRFDPHWAQVLACVLISTVLLLGLRPWRHFSSVKVSSRKTLGVLFFGAIVVAFVLAGSVWAHGYLSPVYVEKLMLGGWNDGIRYGNQDTLFHSTLAENFLTFGKFSTGLDGLPSIRYHAGSHVIIGTISALIGFLPIFGYQLIYPVIILPVLGLALAQFAGSVRRFIFALPAMSVQMEIAFALTTPLVLFVIARPDKYAQSYIGNAILSESYIIALCLQLFTLAAVLWSLANPASKLSKLSLLCLPIMVAILSFVKISTGALTVAALAPLLLTQKQFKLKAFVLCLVGVAFILVHHFTALPLPLKPVAFAFMSDVSIDTLHWFVLGHFCWLWLFLIVRKISAVKVQPKFAGVSLDLVLLGTVTLAGLIPAAILPLQGTWQYFSDCQRWIAFSMILALMPEAWQKIKYLSRKGLHLLQRPLFPIGIALCIWMASLFAQSLTEEPRMLISEVREIHQHLFHPASFAKASEALEQSPNFALVNSLLNIHRDSSRAERSVTLLHIPKSNRIFWNSLPICQGNFWGPATPFLATSLSGFAMVAGLSENNCGTSFYGIPDYENSGVDVKPLTTDAEVCGRAQQFGFSKVLFLEMNPATRGLHSRKLRCI